MRKSDYLSKYMKAKQTIHHYLIYESSSANTTDHLKYPPPPNYDPFSQSFLALKASRSSINTHQGTTQFFVLSLKLVHKCNFPPFLRQNMDFKRESVIYEKSRFCNFCPSVLTKANYLTKAASHTWRVFCFLLI